MILQLDSLDLLFDRHGNRIVIVLGGTGVAGRRIVKHLHEHEFLVRIASRHPDRARVLLGEEDPRLQPTMADIHTMHPLRRLLLADMGLSTRSASGPANGDAG